jgi:hypothetical protein
MDPLSDDANCDGNFTPDRRLGRNIPVEAARDVRARQGKDPSTIHWQAERGFWGGTPPRLEHLASFYPQLALGIGLFGFAWAAGAYFSGDQSARFSTSNSAASLSASEQDKMARAELGRAVQKMAGEIQALQASIGTLRAEQSQAAKVGSRFDVRLDAVKSETSAAIAAMAVKAERIQHEPDAKLSQIADRLDRLEHKIIIPAAGAGAPPTPGGAPMKTAQLTPDPIRARPENGEGPRKPRLITNWVVRDVYGGMALLESTHGTIEVAPGEIVPGAGRVMAIERRGPGWIVITSKGLVDSARDVYLP